MGGNIKFDVNGEKISGQRIHSYDITDTLKEIAKKLEMPYSEIHNNVLGSVYKTDSSGDIDIAIDDEKYNYQEVLDHLNVTHDWVKESPGFNIIHLLVEIEGQMSKKILNDDEYNGFVQVDLMFGNPEWLKFTYFSPGKKSKYKGMFRTELIFAIALTKTQFIDKDERDEVLGKIGVVTDRSKGMFTQHRMRRTKKNGEGFVKRLTAVDSNDAEWKQRYGDVDHKDITIKTPDEAAEFIFGRGTKAKDIQTFEQVKKLFDKMPKDKRFVVNKIFYDKVGFFVDDVPQTM